MGCRNGAATWRPLVGVAVTEDQVTHHGLEDNLMEEMSGYEDVEGINLPYILKLNGGGESSAPEPGGEYVVKEGSRGAWLTL